MVGERLRTALTTLLGEWPPRQPRDHSGSVRRGYGRVRRCPTVCVVTGDPDARRGRLVTCPASYRGPALGKFHPRPDAVHYGGAGRGTTTMACLLALALLTVPGLARGQPGGAPDRDGTSPALGVPGGVAQLGMPNRCAALPSVFSTMQRCMVLTRGDYPRNGVFGWNLGGMSELLSVQNNIDAGDTSHSAPNSIAGYANVVTGNAGGVGVFGQGNAGVDTNGAWGMNTLCANYAADDIGGTTGHSTICYGIEVDVNIAPLAGGGRPLGKAMGVDIAGSSRVLPMGGAYAVNVDRYSDESVGLGWTAGLVVCDGCATTGVALGAAKRTAHADGTSTSATSADSQPLTMKTVDANGTQRLVAVQGKASGALLLMPAAAGAGVVAAGDMATAGVWKSAASPIPASNLSGGCRLDPGSDNNRGRIVFPVGVRQCVLGWLDPTIGLVPRVTASGTSIAAFVAADANAAAATFTLSHPVGMTVSYIAQR